MDTTRNAKADPAQERLASELADVRASIALVQAGVATSITLTSMRFGHELADGLGADAAGQGVRLEASFGLAEDSGDLHVSLIEGQDSVAGTDR